MRLRWTTLYKGKSLPVRGAWIEMRKALFASACVARRSPCGERGLKFLGHKALACDVPSLPVRGAWIEMFRSKSGRTLVASLPVRGAWIEIRLLGCANDTFTVAPRAGSVD